jgi:hypothetical protein
MFSGRAHCADDRERPILAARGVVRRRLINLAQWIYQEFRSKKLLRAWTKLRARSRAPDWD